MLNRLIIYIDGIKINDWKCNYYEFKENDIKKYSETVDSNPLLKETLSWRTTAWMGWQTIVTHVLRRTFALTCGDFKNCTDAVGVLKNEGQQPSSKFSFLY